MAKKKQTFGSLMEMLEFFKQTGSKGGKKAASGMTPEQRRERARKAAAASAKVRSQKAHAKKAAKSAQVRKAKAAAKRKPKE